MRSKNTLYVRSRVQKELPPYLSMGRDSMLRINEFKLATKSDIVIISIVLTICSTSSPTMYAVLLPI